MRTLLRITYPILDLSLHFTLYIMFYTWSVTQYPIKTTSILVICKMNCLIPPIYAELMYGHRHKRERDSPPCLEAFPK